MRRRSSQPRQVALNGRKLGNHFQLSRWWAEGAKGGVLKQIGLGRQFKKEADSFCNGSSSCGGLNNMMMFYLEAPGIIGAIRQGASWRTRS